MNSVHEAMDKLSDALEDPRATNYEVRDAAIRLLETLNHPKIEIIEWLPSTPPPDEDTSVLVCTEDGSAGEAYFDTGVWLWTNDLPVGEPVTHWAEMPGGPR